MNETMKREVSYMIALMACSMEEVLKYLEDTDGQIFEAVSGMLQDALSTYHEFLEKYSKTNS